MNNTRTVLIVDDQKINRNILRHCLETDYRLLEAANGQEALEILRANAETISAVLLDIIMPVLDGYGVLSAMKDDPALSKIPVIVFSQKDGDEAEEKALELGAQDFIAKPYKANIIRHRLNNTIRLRETAAIINRVEKDELTGLLSKQFFIERVGEELRLHPENAYDLIAIGVKHFKLINDTYGTETGDRLLRLVGLQLQKDPVVLYSARFSTDHFYLLLPRQEDYTAASFVPFSEMAQKLSIDMEVQFYCGIYRLQPGENAVAKICSRARLAAGLNKGKYKQSFSFYDDAMQKKHLNEQFILTNMKTALAERQFTVYYQPKYDLGDEKIVGAEALVRWIHPTKGFISPGEFIPLFEHNGFITALDEYVWESACRDIRDWMDKGYPPIAISVNVSRADVYNPKLTDILLGLLAKYCVPIRYLHLEITESAYTNNPEQIIKSVSSLRKLGFIIEMDDFGSGYSSLNMLAQMPVDVLKLDIGFVQHETTGHSDRGIMSFVISLAKWLNLTVVAEGVETAEQIAMLRAMDCTYVQGFYYAKPMKKTDFDNLLQTNKVTEMKYPSRTMSTYAQSTGRKPFANPEREMLIVDDIDLNRAILSSTFAKHYRIVEKTNGKEAWAYLLTHHTQVEVVLLDLLMPVMDGFQLLEKIRGNEDMCDLPVIITTQGDPESQARALQMQADDFLSKPYRPEIIEHRVQNVVESRRLRVLTKTRRIRAEEENTLTPYASLSTLVESLKTYFDIVRLVDPEKTLVCDEGCENCEMHACYAIWGKAARCNHCISLDALRHRDRRCKLEYSEQGLYFVIAQYVAHENGDLVIEMVSKIDDAYVDRILDKEILYAQLDTYKQKALHDALTGVYNRAYIDKNLDSYIQHARASNQPLDLAMIDIDAFKLLNDTYGHIAGDTALRTVANILAENVAHESGNFVARYGGDEFLVLCKGLRHEEFIFRLRAAAGLIQHIQTEDGDSAPISISAGCVRFEEFPTYGVKEFIHRADRRLYAAKVKGRGLLVDSD